MKEDTTYYEKEECFIFRVFKQTCVFGFSTTFNAGSFFMELLWLSAGSDSSCYWTSYNWLQPISPAYPDPFVELSCH